MYVHIKNNTLIFIKYPYALAENPMETAARAGHEGAELGHDLVTEQETCIRYCFVALQVSMN